MHNVRLGLIGLGSMGAVHARTVLDGQVPRVTLTAVCDPEVDLASFAPAKAYANSGELIRSGEVDAVLIATPHLYHAPIGIDALRHGLHVLMEKPIAIQKADAERLLAAHTNKNQVFAVMFNQRTDPHYVKLRELVRSGELGEVRRINWIITNWFRTEAYYRASAWRATWAGEGGGVLLNQCPHNLDLLQWIFGRPLSIRAFCQLGRYHEIEVEDEVTAYFEYANGANGVFITSTGEAPGTNRLEVTTDRGRLVLEDGKISWLRTEVSVAEFCQTCPERWSTPPIWKVDIPVQGSGEQHLGILKNFAAAILDGAPLIAPAADGIYSVELANAMLQSAYQSKTIPLPLNAKAYAAVLKKRIAASRFEKKVVKVTGPRDLANSFGKH